MPLPSTYRSSRSPSRPAAFSVVELLLSAVLLGAVLGSISLLLRSELSSSRQALNSSAAGEVAAQAVTLIREEVSDASNVLITSTAPTGCTTSPSVVLVGPGDAWRIAYGVRAITSAEAPLWVGPSVLVRCGLPYGSTGALNTSGTVAETVVADRLPSSGGLVVTSTGGSAGGTTNELIRDIAITLSLSGITPVSFSARIGVNRLYGVTDRLSSSDCPYQVDGNLCSEAIDDTLHFWPTGSGVSVIGGDTKENVIYFKNNRSTYTISNPCTSITCTVTGTDVGVTITNGDLLVFADQELRL